jgi:hypothetical protein
MGSLCCEMARDAAKLGSIYTFLCLQEYSFFYHLEEQTDGWRILVKKMMVLSLALMLLTSLGASQNAVAEKPQPAGVSTSEEAKIKQILKEFFAARCDVIMGGAPGQLPQFYAPTSAAAAARATYESQYLVRYYVEPMRYHGRTIYHCQYDLSIMQVSVDQNRAEVSVEAIVNYEWGRPEWSTHATTSELEGIHHFRFDLAQTGAVTITEHEYTDFFGGHLPSGPFQPAKVYTSTDKPAESPR